MIVTESHAAYYSSLFSPPSSPFVVFPLCLTVSISLFLFPSFDDVFRLLLRDRLSSLFQQPPLIPAALLPLPLQPPKHNTASAIGLVGSFLPFFFHWRAARAADYSTLDLYVTVWFLLLEDPEVLVLHVRIELFDTKSRSTFR